mgnify:CR=1 FL=1
MNFDVLEINIYPVKSFRGISLISAFAMDAGFEFDRRWMLIDENNRFISQREFPILAQFITKIENNQLSVNYKDSIVSFDTNLAIFREFSAKIWDDEALVQEINLDVSDWFSEIIGAKCKLVKLKSDISRFHFSSKLNQDIPVSLADGYPYLIIGDKSLDLLNSKLDKPIEMNRFRPNIVIKTDYPHQEDDLDTISIGEVSFCNVKPCGRCTIVNTNQIDSLIGKEPLKTLSTYRKFENSVNFGSNFRCEKNGVISIEN